MVSDVNCSNRTSEQRTKMSSLNWAIRRLSETQAEVMEAKCREPCGGGEREAKLQRVEERMDSGRTEKRVDCF